MSTEILQTENEAAGGQSRAGEAGANLTAVLERTQQALDEALNRMDRARCILTDGNPRPECNWGMLDTSYLRSSYVLGDK